MFPDKVDRIILDGVMDTDLYYSGFSYFRWLVKLRSDVFQEIGPLT